MAPSDGRALETSTESVTRTVVLGLETSQAKLEDVCDGVAAYQQVVSHMADSLPSYPEHEWEPHHTHMYHHAKRALPDDRPYKTTVALTAQQEVARAYKSWRAQGKDGDHPQGEFGDGRYLRLRGDDVTVARNDRGWGLKTRFICREAVWFHIDDGAFQRRFLERITDDDDPASAGAAELHLEDDGGLTCHLSVTWPIEVYEPDTVSTAIGVDLNDHPLAVAAAVTDGSVHGVEFVPGREYRHHRERLKRKRGEAMHDNNLDAAKTSLTYRRYTDQVIHTTSRRIVDFATEHTPSVLVLEDLTHYRETAKDPIHDWPFAMLLDQIAYKATERQLPTVFVDPRDTSITCRRCRVADPGSRDGDRFHCSACGYEVHADLNAAVNIARRGVSG